MAFSKEVISVGNVKLFLTSLGMRELLDPKRKLDFKYFSLDDKGYNYDISATTTSPLITSVTGNELKTRYNDSTSNITFTESPIRTDQINKRVIKLIDDCNNTEYGNVDITVYVGNYLQKLRDAYSNLSSVPSTFKSNIRFFDNIKLYEYIKNAFGELKLWNTKDVDFVYRFASEGDMKNYKLLTNTYVKKTQTSSSVVYDTNRFVSPFMFGPDAFKDGTNTVYTNGPLNFELYPVSKWGYVTNTNEFFQPQQLTQDVYNRYKTIKPVINFNNTNFEFVTDNSIVYKSQVNREIFRAKGLLEYSINTAVNFFNFYGSKSNIGHTVKVLPIKLRVNLMNTADASMVLPKDLEININFTLDSNQSNWTAGTIYEINGVTHT